MDGISALSAVSALGATGALAAHPAGAAGVAQAGYGASLNDVAAFEGALARARSAGAQGFASPAVQVQPAHSLHAPGEALNALFKPLEHINSQAAELATQARVAQTEGRALTPSEMVLLTVKCHEFMFHCQLTANVANRTSDGLQQLFKQQA